MPTGYTADIAKGISFEQYALNCARAFGALIMMRDDPADAPIPEKFEPSDWHVKRKAEDETRLASLRAMTPAEAETAAQADYDASMARWIEQRQERAALRDKYEAMLTKVRAYEAPTADHVKLKEFMESQILESISFDCSTDYDDRNKPVKCSGADWHQAQIAEAERSIRYHAKEHAAEVTRAEGRTAWVAALRASLQPSAS